MRKTKSMPQREVSVQDEFTFEPRVYSQTIQFEIEISDVSARAAFQYLISTIVSAHGKSTMLRNARIEGLPPAFVQACKKMHQCYSLNFDEAAGPISVREYADLKNGLISAMLSTIDFGNLFPKIVDAVVADAADRDNVLTGGAGSVERWFETINSFSITGYPGDHQNTFILRPACDVMIPAFKAVADGLAKWSARLDEVVNAGKAVKAAAKAALKTANDEDEGATLARRLQALGWKMDSNGSLMPPTAKTGSGGRKNG